MGWQLRDLEPQAGHTVLVTGASSGIGLAASRALFAHGAHVVLGVRNIGRGERAAQTFVGPGSASIIELELSDLDQVAECASGLFEQLDELSAVVCNAGVMAGPFLLTTRGFERQMATNHLGHVALVSGLWPLLEASASRVVMMSSIAARAGRLSAGTTMEQLLSPAPYDGRQVYSNTKQANLLFAVELHRRCVAAASPVSVVAVHPGLSATNLFARELELTGHASLGRATRLFTGLLLPSA
ncbi:MAG: SDR family NAD(P)-dependent oxidoreductase, partial [Opitutaceae bacterium]